MKKVSAKSIERQKGGNLPICKRGYWYGELFLD